MMLRRALARLRMPVAATLATFLLLNVFGGWVSVDDLRKAVSEAYPVRAVSQYTPTSGALIEGTETTITSGATTGNTGSWKGTLASDNFRWIVNATASGVDQQLAFDGAQLNGANKLIVVMEAAASNTTLQRSYQICDWSSGTQVDDAADASCTGGGWRTLNVRKAAVTSASEVAYTWHVYNGYWSDAGDPDAALSTPLSNFIRSSDGRILLRAYATTSCASCTHTLDYARVTSVIDPIYAAAGVVNQGTGAVTGEYRNTTNALFTGQSGSDNVRLQVAGTATSTADFYLPFKNVRTYPGMNAILVRAEYSCSATGISHRPRIWNFTTGSWEDLSSSSIPCSTTEVTGVFTLSNVNADDYISNGEVRVGWRGLANGTQGIRLDMVYVIMGSVNADSSRCEISFGTGTASDCANTRTLDTTATASTWQQTSEAESTSFGHDYYAQDNDADANTNEQATSANLWLPVGIQNPARVTGLLYSMYWRSNATTMTSQGQFSDNSGFNATISGGWTAFGTTNASTNYTYEDSVTNGYFASNPGDYTNPDTGEVNVRIRTSVSTASSPVTRDIGFVFASVQWAETTPGRYTLKVDDTPTSGALIEGTETTITSGATTGNTGSWKGTLASDNFRWIVNATASGVDQQLAFDGAQLNGANKLIVVMEAAASNTTLQRSYQICDWSSGTQVDDAADASCTGGGWRTLNVRKAAVTSASEVAYTWHVYNGYWSDAGDPDAALSTPLSNFIRSSDGRILLRAYATTSCASCTHTLDYARVTSVIDPIYAAAGVVNQGTGAVTGEYRNTTNALFTGQSGSDNVRLQVAGTATSTADFYLPFKNVRTYPGMNAILVRAEYSCSATGISHRPRIWNFTTGSWEDLSSSSIPCSTTEVTGVFTLSNVNADDYISNGEVRVGWRGLANGTQGIRLDMVYVIMGSVNADSSRCEISFGTGTASDCANTRTLDTTATASTWQQTSEAESTSFGHDYYAKDNDGDAVSNEQATSANLDIAASIPANAQLAGRVFAMYWRSNATTMTSQGGFKDYSGGNATVVGGWTAFGATNALVTYGYTDSVISGYFASNSDDYVDTFTGNVNVKVRTTASTASSPVTRDIGLVFTSVQWVEPAGVTPAITLTLDAGSAALGNLTSGVPALATSTATVLAENLASGYALQVNRASSSATMTRASGAETIPDLLAWNPTGSGNATSSPGQTLAFRVASSTASFNATWWGSGTPLFAGFPVAATTVMSCTACNAGSTATVATYRVDVPATQATGAYAGTVTYTALANP